MDKIPDIDCAEKHMKTMTLVKGGSGGTIRKIKPASAY
jgi:hypothetical protein